MPASWGWLPGRHRARPRPSAVNGRRFTVIGVLQAWAPQPHFYDLNYGGSFDLPEDIFMPFDWVHAAKLSPWSINCVRRNARVSGAESLFTEDCVWLQYWVELDSAAARDRLQAFVDNYVRDQKQHGRFPRKLNNRIVNVAGWLEMNDVIGDDSRTQVAIATGATACCARRSFR